MATAWPAGGGKGRLTPPGQWLERVCLLPRQFMSLDSAAAGHGTCPSRTQLPIPDIQPPSLTTFDAKDPDTAYPPIEPLLPPARSQLTVELFLLAGLTYIPKLRQKDKLACFAKETGYW